MIFLIEYNRPEGRLMSFRSFDASRSPEAKDLRLKMELALHQKGIDHEVVLLEAEDEQALRKTHRRYFENLGDLLQPTAGTLGG